MLPLPLGGAVLVVVGSGKGVGVGVVVDVGGVLLWVVVAIAAGSSSLFGVVAVHLPLGGTVLVVG